MGSRLVASVGGVLAALVLAAPASAAIDFGSPTPFAAGGPRAVATADLNADRKSDLVVAGGNTVAVRLGDGAGGFGGATAFATGVTSNAVAIGLLNADAVPDLAVTNINSNNVSVLLGLGDGTFGPATNITVGTGPVGVAIRDLNGDGQNDLAVANAFTNDVSVLLGTGGGGFGSATNFSAGGGPADVVAGNFNSATDSIPDLAVPNEPTDTVSVLLGTGGGGFAAPVTYLAGDAPFQLAIGDLDGNGTPDLVTANHDSDNVSVLLGVTNGTFTHAPDVTVHDFPRSVAIKDLDWDAKPDVMTANETSGDVSVLRGHGDGTFDSALNFASADAFWVAPSPRNPDFNKDGRPDLAVINQAGNAVNVFLNATPLPRVGIHRNRWTYNARPVGTQSGLVTFTIRNAGIGGPLTFGGIALGGANPGDFALANDTCTPSSGVAPGSSCTVQARFAPTATNARSATIDITDNASGSPHHIALSGTGT